MSAWIDITEYASKFGVSASTLRRRIRQKTIEFKMERGKYLLPDTADALAVAPLFSRQLPRPSGKLHQTAPSTTQLPAAFTDPVQGFMQSSVAQLQGEYDRLLVENRRLKSQIEELQTLVKALEAEIDSSPNQPSGHA